MSCAARSSLQPALVPLEAFEVLVPIALTAETASWHPYCHAIVTQFVAVPSSATLPSFLDDGAVARDWPVLGVG
jgi:hypothetical protein